MYSQNQEESFITEYFKDKKGTVLDIGANDGKTFSNSLRLIELGWSGVLVEPSPSCAAKILELHKNNQYVAVCQYAIGTITEQGMFHESGKLDDPLLKGADNKALVSTLIESEKDRWGLDMQWEKYPVSILSWPDFLVKLGFNPKEHKFNFITIDAEGLDVYILEQMDLTELGTEMICVEWNCNNVMKDRMIAHAAKHGLVNIIYQSGENILITK